MLMLNLEQKERPVTSQTVSSRKGESKTCRAQPTYACPIDKKDWTNNLPVALLTSSAKSISLKDRCVQ